MDLLPKDCTKVIRDSPRKPEEEESQDPSEPAGLGSTDDT